jgi:hypothetical protein
MTKRRGRIVLPTRPIEEVRNDQPGPTKVWKEKPLLQGVTSDGRIYNTLRTICPAPS